MMIDIMRKSARLASATQSCKGKKAVKQAKVFYSRVILLLVSQQRYYFYEALWTFTGRDE